MIFDLDPAHHKYYVQIGMNPEIKAVWTVRGPQIPDNIPKQVTELLDRPTITEVVIIAGDETRKTITHYSRLDNAIQTKT